MRRRYSTRFRRRGFTMKRRRSGFRRRRYAKKPRFYGPWPKYSAKRNLCYNDQFTFDVSTTAPVKTQTYRLNDIYDFDAATGGHQPLGFDEIFAEYQFAYVVGTKVIVKCSSAATSNINPTKIGWMISPDATPPAYDNYTTFVEDQHRRGRQIGILNNIDRQKWVIKWSAKKYFGKNIVGNTEYSNSVDSGPGIHAYLHLFAWLPPLQTTDPAPVIMDVLADFCVVFKQREANTVRN